MPCQPDFTATFADRTTAAPIPGLDPFVAAWSRHVDGGDRRALIDLCDYAGELEPLLGAQVTINVEDDADADPCWCGYVAYLRRCCSDGLCCGYVAWGLSLDDMWNRIAVSYTHGDASLVTEFAEDAASIAAYGVKEVIVPLPADSLLTPEQYRDRLLEAVSQAQPVLYTGSQCECDITYVVARGWWETLGWQLYRHECGYADSGAGAGTVIPLGLSFTSDLVGMDERSEISYLSVLGDELAAFPVGEQIRITGAANPANNVVTTITRRLRAPSVHGVTGNTLAFDPSDDILDAANGLTIFQTGEMIRISGSDLNDGFHFVKRVLADGSRLEVSSGGILAEPAGQWRVVETSNSPPIS